MHVLAFQILQVCSNYSPVYVKKTFPAIQNLEKTGGNAIFTFPMPPLKCPGAPQKISYMTDDYLRKVPLLNVLVSLCSSFLKFLFCFHNN